ncbi:DUF2167 domain-containing protein [Hymenobacter sp. H14-R3]|uniref:DUF2167 domain-containing protein n=1 Tax=Hymenobacter sp. H14-R3 TaxID=3046308 RepID=UPI0024BB518D|nr:DUF2167 domain-containing protein [Hymenobacter sp. H14-R3]MDJ0365009.1 DUF2167 domain-containing protein [Hymenobacter sp. H14-R3]
MKKLLLVLGSCIALSFSTQAALPRPKPKPVLVDSAAVHQAQVDSINGTFVYQGGLINLPGGVGKLTVPPGFLYLDSGQAAYVMHKLWRNPPQESLGMLFPEDRGPMSDNTWGYLINFDPMGHVQDDDADDIKYDELLEEMQKDVEEENQDRTKDGYRAVHLIGWGAPPYYDKKQHTLHWAKLLRFGDGLDETLNYNVRILGRKGVLVFNAIAEPQQLPEIKASIPALLANVTFVKGQQYNDFSSGIDEVAVYGIGGLVAGKVLAKVGLFAIVVKFWKLGLLALGGAWAGLRRFFGFEAKEE